MSTMSEIVLVHGRATEVAGGFGAPPPIAMRALTGSTSNRGTVDAPTSERVPPMTVIAGGKIVGDVQLRSALHPDGLVGASVELVLSAADGTEMSWLAPAVQAVADYVRRVGGIGTLIAAPAADQAAAATVAAALTGAGFIDPKRSGIYRKELLSPLWRGPDVFIIAEAGSNWRMGSPRRDLAMAQALVEVAAEAGADAVKFQTFRPETVYVAEAGSSDYLAEAGITESIRDIFSDIAMPYEMLPKLAEHARVCNIGIMSTAFSAADFAAVDPLVSVHKIASYEISHVRLIELAARSGKPVIMSTGAATLDDVAWAVEHFRQCGGRDLCLMQCTAKYPAPLDALNLATIPELGRLFGVPVGLSDHSREPVVGPLAATALGARVIEKHFTLHNRLPGPDHPFAVTPAELKQMVEAVRAANVARGSGLKEVSTTETELAAFAQRGLQAIASISPGDVLREDVNIAILRPGKQPKGVHPRHLRELAGKRATRAIRSGEGLRPGDWADG